MVERRSLGHRVPQRAGETARMPRPKGHLLRFLVVGPVPPPIDGRAMATGWLLDELKVRGGEVRVVDTQLDLGFTRGAAKLVRCIRGAMLILFFDTDRVVVIASGGSGLIGEVIPLLAARLRRVPAFLVHHSSAYVAQPSRLVALVIRLGGRSLRHVMLSDGMLAEFAKAYGVLTKNCLIVNNAALIPSPTPVSGVARQRNILHLANLSREKGTLVALDVIQRLPKGSLSSARFAGPATDEVLHAFDVAKSTGLALEYLGSISGAYKAAEFAAARVFLFPSMYAHEAQPLVIYEAVAQGAVPVVWARGWIAEQMRALNLSQFVYQVGDVDGLLAASLDLLSMTDEEFAEVADNVRHAFHSLQRSSKGQIDQLSS